MLKTQQTIFLGDSLLWFDVIRAIGGGCKGRQSVQLAGAGAGVGAQILTRGKSVNVPAESLLTYRLSLRQPLRAAAAR